MEIFNREKQKNHNPRHSIFWWRLWEILYSKTFTNLQKWFTYSLYPRLLSHSKASAFLNLKRIAIGSLVYFTIWNRFW